jgi:hypothetical protein
VFSGLPGLLCSTLMHIDASAEVRLRRRGPDFRVWASSNPLICDCRNRRMCKSISEDQDGLACLLRAICVGIQRVKTTILSFGSMRRFCALPNANERPSST